MGEIARNADVGVRFPVFRIREMLGLLELLNTADIPRMARPNYRHELGHMLLWSVFANLIDGAFSSIVVAKTFGASPLLVPIVWATPMLAHLFSFVWGIVVRGRPRVATYSVLALCAVGSAASVALTPSTWNPWGGWIFAGQIALARIFLSGIVTVRSAIWAANYPPSHRARIAGRVQLLNGMLMLITGISISSLFDQHPEYYRFVYPGIALLGLLSLIPLRRIRVRGEAGELARFRARTLRDGMADHGGWSALWHGFKEAAAILKRDRAFARYCTAQYCLGSANFFSDPVLAIVITTQLGFSYFQSSLILDQIPLVVVLLSIRFWSHLFDRIGVLRFRVWHSVVWLGSITLLTAAIALIGERSVAPWAAVGLLVASRLVSGTARAGGAIAWNLGHLHFASEHQGELYMGIHVALTGLRGVIMPSIGALAYQAMGWWSFLIAVAFSLVAVALFQRLAASQAPAERSAEPANSDSKSFSLEAIDAE